MINTIQKMQTFSMNPENSKTNKPHKFRLKLADKISLKDPNKNMTLANLRIYYTCKNTKTACKSNKFKTGIMYLICLMVHTLFETFKTILSTLLKNLKLWQIILLYKFM